MQLLVLLKVDDEFSRQKGCDGILNKINHIPEFVVEDWRQLISYNEEEKFIILRGTIAESYDD